MNRRTVAFRITTIALLAGAVLAAQSGSMSSWQLDPPLLLGGRDGDAAVAVASDGAGNTYVVGLTSSLDFPTRLPFFRPASATPFSQWGFLTKLDARYQITYSTYLDGIPSAVAVGADGTAVVVGMKSYDDQRPWIAKVDASGSRLLFAIELDTAVSSQASGVAVDSSGNIFVVGTLRVQRSRDFGDGFVAKIAPSGEVVSMRLLAGTRTDTALGVATDREGSVYVAGTSNSPDFPISAGAFQRTMNGAFTCFEPHPSFGLTVPAFCPNAFVIKLAPDAATIRYSTFVGGSSGEGGVRIAVDASGAAYLAGVTSSIDFPVTRAFQGACASDRNGQCSDAFVAKLSADGTALEYATYLGGTRQETIGGIAVKDGEAFIAAYTSSSDFPVRDAAQRVGSSGPILKSTDGADSWFDVSRTVGAAGIWTLVSDGSPTRPTPYAAGGSAVLRSTDGGEHWTAGRLPAGDATTLDLAVDQQSRSIVYAAGQVKRDGLYEGGLFKSLDGGTTWTLIAERREAAYFGVAVAPADPSMVYVPSNGTLYRSTDGGSTLTPRGATRGAEGRGHLVVDARTPTTLYAAGSGAFSASPDGGVTWLDVVFHRDDRGNACLARDPSDAATFYACGDTAVYRSINSGLTWTRGSGIPPDSAPTAIAVDPFSPATIYAGTIEGLYRSTDRGATWKPTALRTPVGALVADPVQSGVLYVARVSVDPTPVIVKLDARGSLSMSTFAGVSGDTFTGIALHADGRVAAVGVTIAGEPMRQVTPNDALVRVLAPAGVVRLPRNPGGLR